MKRLLKNLIVKSCPNAIKRIFYEENARFYKTTQHTEFASLSYSQEGEDLILRRFFGKRKDIFYVDIGAHHPFRFSNTYIFYQSGGRGINVDPLPGAMILFDEHRGRDINLEIAIANKEQSLTYHLFEEAALNGFSKELSEQRRNLANSKLIGIENIETYKLTTVLDRYMPKNQPIDFMSVDVEGFDLQVLQSNDWSRYRPMYVLAEELHEIISPSLEETNVTSFLSAHRYEVVARTVNTLIFKDTTKD